MNPRRAHSVRRGVTLSLAAVALLAGGAGGAFAAEDFYKGKQVSIMVSGAGSYDAYARLLAKYLPKYIPGEPNFIVKNMTGASGLKAANYIYNAAPKDGTEIAGTHGHIPTIAVFRDQGVQYDATKLAWIGSVTKEIFMGYVWHNAPIQSMLDARTKEAIVGGQALGSMSIDIPVLANAMMGTRFKIVTGYSGSNEVRLAIERGEIHGVFGTAWSSLMNGQPDWIANKSIKVVAQFGEKAHPELPGVPSLLDFVVKPEDRQALQAFLARQETGKPYFAPPGTPPERLAILRRAFDAAVRDPAFLEEAAKSNLDVDGPMTGQEIEALVVRMSKTPPAVAQRINDVFDRFGATK